MSSTLARPRFVVGMTLAATLLATGIGWRLARRAHAEAASAPPDGLAERVPSPGDAARAASAAKEADVIKDLEVSKPLPPDPAQGTAAAAEATAATTAKRTYGKLFALRDFFDRGRIEDAAFARLATDPAQVDTARRLLTDTDFAVSRFGGDLAVARVYAIKLLTYMARTGNDAPILAAVTELRVNLTQHGERVKAQSEDLVQLVQGYTAFRDKEAVARDPMAVLEALGIDGEDTSTEGAKLVAQATFAGIALGLRAKLPVRQLEELLKRAFPKTARGA